MRIVRYNYPSYRNGLVSTSFPRTPWSGLESEIDRLFATVVEAPRAQFPVDLYEDAANAYVRAELPGISREDLNVEMVDGSLTISGSRKTPAVEGQAEQTVSFSRSLTIPADVAADQVSAAYESGVLTVTLPKREEAKPKKITVAVK